MSKGKRTAKAAEYFRRAPNYSGEAISFLRRYLDLIPNDEDARKVGELLCKMESAHKFALPDYGEIMGAGLSESMIEAGAGARLPFPAVAIEYAAPPKDRTFAAEAGRSLMRKRIVLGDECELDGRTGAAFYFFAGAGEKWTPSKAALFLDYTKGSIFPAFFGNSGAALREELLAEGHVGEGLTEFVIKENRHEFTSIFQLLAALSCSNVSTEIIRPNREARAARPASTLFDYHVLMIHANAERHDSAPAGGSHASPRTHLRRGHIRHHPTAGRIWINSTVVNPSAVGTVNKDYRVVP